ncbi:hypothetical protein KM1_331520 [Entamoeba histolytica HM-3:IMSS]|uniref:Uncharacterized protein n=4 Tax=Entamoeba histolytica TaxID=5759 RepID=C4M6E6_ENTH1|nr:hypothetical protein EHI_145260 [Entamoeba histolytica HM-1:IMSS]XP_652824.1 hypothetical protein EHI_145310 [Entamoeba histolytica HM-1:IMSS]EMD45114.1 Hypothetical protein EHI5A_197390 [Entamoeba histolytica KU27]EMS10885.1 hypothetical protein KM1_331520 [Entamoeba histolytica HM-3:IMSS]GAT97047.1 hypothetical protein CL6EHI_145260 [Entamoeba histolytica]EAL43374.1 hypothetical protein EHI_145260 [Entamoeba histolytica HM-1:IMSS]EAL47438.1 hypothetical protein EHI_145310 [Entamoeba hist|eukprot:XP_648760.1 hypothetical protein EHI_145260 [Entamoeba histolytica HM-1:IMSS]
MTTIKDMIADHAMGKFVYMDADEFIDTMVKLVNSIEEYTKDEEIKELKKPYWSLVYRIARKKRINVGHPKKKEEQKKEYKNRFIIKDKKKEEETKPKKESN